MFTEETIISQIAVDESGIVSVRRSLHVLRDDVRISTTFHRTTYEPGAALDDEDPRVQAIAAIVWTDAIKAAAIARREQAVADLMGGVPTT